MNEPTDENPATDKVDPFTEPIPLTPGQERIVRQLLDKVNATKTELALDRQARENDRRIADRNSILTWALLGILAIFLIGGAALGALYVGEQDRRERDRREQELAACARGNETRSLINDLNEGTQDLANSVLALSGSLEGIIGLVNVPNPDRTPEAQERLDEFIRESTALIHNANNEIHTAIGNIAGVTLQLRDCSPNVVFGPTTTVTSVDG